MDDDTLPRPGPAPPLLEFDGPWNWDAALAGAARHALESLLAAAVPSRRWFGAKARTVRSAHILDTFPIEPLARLALVEFQFDEGAPEVYQLPLAFAPQARAEHLLTASPAAAWADVRATDGKPIGLLYDALFDPEFCTRLLALFETKVLVPGSAGNLAAWQTERFAIARGEVGVPLAPRLSQAEQSNSSVVFGDRLILKLFRRIEQGQNPDLELMAHLTARQFGNVPALAGAIDDRTTTSQVWTLAALQEFVPNQGDAWQYILTGLQTFLRQVAAPPADDPQPLETFVADAQRLGTRTAEMHVALADAANDVAFTPEPLSVDDQRRLADRTRQLVAETFALLRRQIAGIAAEVRPIAQQVFERESAAMSRIADFENHSVVVHRIRCHGDYHLGQVLVTTGDFMIIDFEGEPARPLLQRREKQVALRDVAGMIRSFHYASRAGAAGVRGSAAANASAIDRWSTAWYLATSDAFLRAYQTTAGNAAFVPRDREQFQQLLSIFLLEKAVYELRYELNNRPDWVYLPLAALIELLD